MYIKFNSYIKTFTKLVKAIFEIFIKIIFVADSHFKIFSTNVENLKEFAFIPTKERTKT